jgi:hypothetical protein
MPETNAPRLPRASAQKNPDWLDAIKPYKHGFEAGSADALTKGADEWTELTPDEQAFHQAHLTYRQVQVLGAVFGVLRRIELRLAALQPDALVDNVETIKKAAVIVARGQSKLVKVLAEGGLAGAVRGDDIGEGAARDAAGAGTVLDDDGLAEQRRQLVADDAGDGVDRTARREGHVEFDRARRVLLRGGCHRHQRAKCCQRERLRQSARGCVFHFVPPMAREQVLRLSRVLAQGPVGNSGFGILGGDGFARLKRGSSRVSLGSLATTERR